MLCMLMFCLLTRTLINCSSVMLDGGSVPSVVWVVLVKGMSLWMREGKESFSTGSGAVFPK